MVERVLERLSQSDYRDNFIIKGGFLIGSLIGTENRTTKDIDATIIGIQLEQEQIAVIFNEIFKDYSVDNIKFELTTIQEIREAEFYPSYRLTVDYNLVRLNKYYRKNYTLLLNTIFFLHGCVIIMMYTFCLKCKKNRLISMI